MLERLAAFWAALIAAFDTALFPIGDVTVTPAGLLRVVVIVAAAAFASRAVRGGLVRVSRRWPGTHASSIYTLGRIAHYTLLALGIALGLATIGVDLTSLTVVLGALGIGIGFGLQDTVANFIAGLIILFERHLRVGDFIELESGIAGEVREIRIRATRVATNDNIDILVPNSEFVRGRVVNWTLDEADRRIHVPFGVAYGTDKAVVREAGLAAAARVSYTLAGRPAREPQVWLVRFGDSSLDFELVVWLRPEGVKLPAKVQAVYLWEIHSELEARGIEIPFPQRDLHLRSIAPDAARALTGAAGEVRSAPPAPSAADRPA